jgi:hypothetical protein
MRYLACDTVDTGQISYFCNRFHSFVDTAGKADLGSKKIKKKTDGSRDGRRRHRNGGEHHSIGGGLVLSLPQLVDIGENCANDPADARLMLRHGKRPIRPSIAGSPQTTLRSLKPILHRYDRTGVTRSGCVQSDLGCTALPCERAKQRSWRGTQNNATEPWRR